MIKFLNLSRLNKPTLSNFIKKLPSFFNKSNYILGDELSKFELNFAKYCNTKFCVGVGSGYDALKLILDAIGTKSGDEIIVSSHTFVATWLSVLNSQAKIIPVDTDLDTLNLNISKIKKLITKKTKAIIAVHIYGNPVDIQSIRDISGNKIFIIEDAAQAHGASFKQKKVGSLGDAAAFSFYPGKNLGGIGDGGAITTNNKIIYNKLIKLRNYGSVKKYYHAEVGVNSRLDDLQAMFLNEKLKKLDFLNKKRQKIAKDYLTHLSDKRLSRFIILPNFEITNIHVWHQFVIRVVNRNKLKKYLENCGVEVGIHYPKPPHKQDAFKHLNFEIFNLENTNKISNSILSLPIDPHLSLNEIELICNLIKTFYLNN